MPITNNSAIPAGLLFPRLGSAMTIPDKKSGATTIVSREDYKLIRTQLIDAFEAGGYSVFYGRFDQSIELGDLQLRFKDIVRNLTKTRFHPDHPIDYQTRLKWRNVLLFELDEYVSP